MESLTIEEAIKFLTDQKKTEGFCSFHLKNGKLKAHLE
jgi:hypothetical protein